MVKAIRKNFFLAASLLMLLAAALPAKAQMLSASQVERFNSLTTEQKKALAKQMGLDLSDLISDGEQPSLEQGSTQTDRRPETEKTSRTSKTAKTSSRASSSSLSDTKTSKSKLKTKSTSLKGDELLLEEDLDAEEGEFDFTEEEELISLDEFFEEEDELQAFGYSLFKQPEYSFEPAIDIPIPADYVMGPGDTVVLQLYGKENASYSLVVNREGQIQFPEIGPVSLAGLKFSKAQEVINQTVAEQMIGVKSSVTMGALRSIRVFVLGEVKYPGSYPVNSLSTMTNALFASGGIAEIGSLRNIQLKRSGKLVTTLDLYDLLLDGDTSDDARLLPGDVIFIPPVGKTITIDGEVKRPAIYELNGEKSLQQVIRLAGGLLPTAYPKETRINRIDAKGNRTIVDVDFSTTKGMGLQPLNGDEVIVGSVLETVENSVTLSGHVKRPGGFKWYEGLRVSKLMGAVSTLKANPDLNYALIKREIQPTRRVEVLHFNLGDALQNPGSEKDPVLSVNDEVIVFGYEEDRGEILFELVEQLKLQASKQEKAQVITIYGHVRFEGEYPLTDALSVSDFVDIAGGLSEYAYGLEAEVTRVQYDENEHQSIIHFPVNLASNEAQATVLQPGDQIAIKQIPNWSGVESVTIEGEVAFPGTYTISRGETLSQLLVRAGGLTEYGHANGAIFSRLELRELEEERIKELKTKLEADILAASLEQTTKTNTSVVDAEKLLDDLEDVEPQGRMVIDLPKVVNGGKRYDIELADGDSLVIPRLKRSVTVVGEVQYPTSHIYEDSLDVEDYIERSGGVNKRADDERIYVVKANGRVFLPEKGGWFKRNRVSIEAGDTVVVPLDADRIESLTLWSSVSQIFYQIALGAAAINSF